MSHHARVVLLLLLVASGFGCGGNSESSSGGGEEAVAGPQRGSRDGERPRRVGAIAEKTQARPPVYFIALDGGDWQLLDRLMAAGEMPELARLVREGHRGVLTTEHPPLSPLLWTTMMTGASPLEHAILDFTRYHPHTGEREPIGSTERARPAIWNMATWGGKKVGLFGLWATYPAEAVDGVLVSDRLFGFLNLEDKPPAGAVYPAERQSWATDALRRAGEAVDAEELARFLPWLSAQEYAARVNTEKAGARPYDDPVSALRRILIETRLYDDLFHAFVGEAHPDLAVLYLQGTDSIGHLFAPYVAPRQPEVSAEDFERYRDVPARYFHWLDGLLGRYRERAARDGAVLFFASDHGFLWQEGRPTTLSSFDVSTAAKWHRSEGMYLLWGLPASESTAATGASSSDSSRTSEKSPLAGGIRQVCASLLTLIGLPPGAGVAGPPLPPLASPAGEAATDYTRVFTELRAREARAEAGGESEPSGTRSSADASAALAKLRALGYLDGAEQDRAPPAAIESGSTRTAASYNNEALILQRDGRKEEARAAFEKALEINPDLASALWNLSDLELGSENYDRADQLLLSAVKNDLPEAKSYLIGRAISYQRDGKLPRSMALLEHAVEIVPNEDEYWLFLGRYRIETKDCAGALQAFERAAPLAPDNAAIPASIGVAHLCLGQRESAVTAFRRSLALDAEQPKVREFLRELGAAR
jgi:tetratricopeptide (TPR) repeat protein